MNTKKTILKFLQNNIHYSYNTPTIYRHLKGNIPLNTIRSDLKRLYEEKLIHKPSRGFYQAKINIETIDLLENPPTLLHAITINTISPKLQKLGQGAIPPNCKFKTKNDFVGWLKNKDFLVKSYNAKSEKYQYIKHIWWNDRDVIITIHDNFKIILYFGCSNHPLNYFEFRDFYNYVLGYLYDITPFSEEVISEIGINKDFSELELHGFEGLKLRTFQNAWFELYTKSEINKVRFGVHVLPSLGLSDAFLMIESISNPFKRNSEGLMFQ